MSPYHFPRAAPRGWLLSAITAIAIACLAATEASAAGANGQVAYQCENAQQQSDICVLNPDTGARKNLTNDDASDGWPSWSPDGTQIAFHSDNAVYVIQADGGGRRHLMGGFSDPSFEPAWSPDGKQIAFVSTRGGTDYELWTIAAGGEGQPTRLTTTPRDEWGRGIDDYQPTWSPDSSRVAFVSRGRDKTDACDIYAMDVADRDADGNGDGLKRLTTDNLQACSPWEDVNPAWSPTGDQIAYSSTSTGNAEVWVMNSDGSGQRNLTHDPGWDWMPGWSPDGQLVTFTSDRDGDEEIYALAPADAPPAARTASTFSASAVTEPPPVRQLTDNDTQDRMSDWGAAVGNSAPRTAISQPRHGGTYQRSDILSIRGTASDDRAVAGVQVALRQTLKDGACRWWDGSRFVAGRCKRPRWVTAEGTGEWSYTLPRPLKRTRGPVVNYAAFARATDSAGATDNAREQGRNANRFRVEPAPQPKG